VACGSGTYIRSLARDLGEVLGCGGHITALRRTWVEPFLAPDMATLAQIEALAGSGGDAALDARLLPVEAGLAHFPALALDPDQARRLGQGQVLPIPGAAPAETVNITDLNGRSLGLGELREDGSLRPKRLFRWASAQ